jgi:hypothetical protein
VQVQLVGEVSFETYQPARNSEPDLGPITGRVRAEGSRISVTFSRSPSLRGSARSSSRRWADLLGRAGLTVQMVGPYGPVITAGHEVCAPWWQAVATGSRRIRLGSRRAVLDTLRGPRIFDVAVPELLRPPTALRSRPLQR